MRLRGTPVGQVTENDLRALIDARVPESRTVEYKAALPGKADDEKREYLADVSAFANTTGGVIVYGMETERDARGRDTGVPEALLGVGAINLDQEKLRLTQLVHDGLEPSLASQVTFQEVAVAGASGPVLLLGVSRSLSGPHMVWFQRNGKFWRRNEGGKYQPDVQELRRMFLEAKAWTTEADEFRRSRLEMVLRREILPTVNMLSSYFVHVLPLGRLDAVVDLGEPRDQLTQLLTLGDAVSDRHFNADGFFLYARSERGITNYTQWLRCGGVEGYTSEVVRDDPTRANTRVLFGRILTTETVRYVRTALEHMRGDLKLDPPFIVALTLVGAKGAWLQLGSGFLDGVPIDRDRLLVPPVVIENPDTDLDAELQPALDMIWQAAGHPGAPNRQS